MTTLLGKWKLVLYLAGIFAAGAVSGWVVSAKATKEQLRKPVEWRKVYKPLKDLCQARLQLTPEQKEQFDAIIEDHSKLMESMHKGHMRQVRDATSNRSARIMAILTPEQQKEFEAIERERRESWGKGPKGPRPHGKERPSGTPPEGPRSCVQKNERSS